MATTVPDQPPPPPDNEPVYGGYTRFEIELEVCMHTLPSSSKGSHPRAHSTLQRIDTETHSDEVKS